MPLPRPIVSAAALLAVLIASSVRPAAADVVIKNSGERVSGQIVAETDADVTVQSNMQELIIRTKVNKKDIKEIQREALAENRYCRIPIHGEIGVDVKAEWLAKAIQQAVGSNANILVLDIDSPGGEVSEMGKIMEMLTKVEKVKLIAHVHKAMSAAAMIAMTCPTIVVDSHASIGAAVPWKIGPKGTPTDVEAKFFSAYEATCKSAAEFAHHSPLLAQGMMDMNLELSQVNNKGQVLVLESSRVKEADAADAVALKTKGQILCLSGSEALACGLAIGTADKPEELQKILADKDWAPVADTVWGIMEARAQTERADAVQNAQKQASGNQKDSLAKELAGVNARIATLTKTKSDSLAKMDSLRKGFNDAVMKLPPTVNFDAQEKALRDRYQVEYNTAASTAMRADLELQELTHEKTAIEAELKKM